MYLVLVAMPQAMITTVVIESEESESIEYSENVWFDDIIPTANKIMQNYEIEKIAILGPQVYTNHIKEILEDKFSIEVELEEL